MPKQKTHSGAKKRFKVTGSGKIMKQQANLRHNFEGKPTKRTSGTRVRWLIRGSLMRNSSSCGCKAPRHGVRRG